jgi:hypothetical protein
MPNAGYALGVDGWIDAEYQTQEGEKTGAVESKDRFPILQNKIFDIASRTRERIA